jgi:hypothetical protein
MYYESPGEAFITWGFTSVLGPVVLRSLAVNYDGSEYGSSFIDISPIADVEYEKSDVFFVGRGSASTDMEGWVSLGWGSCTIDGPASGAFIY